MYELICPSCQAHRRFAFIRNGARSVCPQCMHPFIIKVDHYTRDFDTAGVQVTSQGKDPLTAVAPATPPPPTVNSGATGLPARAMAYLANVTGNNQNAASPSAAAASRPASIPAAPPAHPAQAHPSQQPPQPSHQAQAIPSTAVPIATAVGTRPVPPVSRLIATKIRQKRRRQMVTWLTLVFVVLLFGVIAAMLVGLNRTQPVAVNPPVVAVAPPVTLMLYKVGPSLWEQLDEPSYPINHNQPLGFEDYGLVPDGGEGDFMLVGTVVCSSFDFYDAARLQLMLVDGVGRIFAKTDISLPPMSGQRENARQAIRIAIPKTLHERLSTVEWEIIPGAPMNDGMMISPQQVTASNTGKETTLHVVYHNQLNRPIYKLSISIRPVDNRGRPLAHWIGQWKERLPAGESVEFLIPTPLNNSPSAVGDWQVSTAAELAQAPLIAPPADDNFDHDDLP